MRTFTTKPLDWFSIPEQVRSSFDDAADRLLGESLRVRQLQPVGAQPDGTLLFGGRRWHGASLVGIETLDVCVTDEPLTESDILLIQMTENLHRRPLTAWEQHQGATALLRQNPTWKAKDLGERLRLEPAEVTKLLAPAKCAAPVREALADGRLGLGHCYAISRADTEAGQMALLEAALVGATRDELDRRVRAAKAAKPAAAPAERVGRIKCPLPSGIVVTLSGCELWMDDVVEALAEAAKAARKARSDGLDAKVWAAVMARKAESAS